MTRNEVLEAIAEYEQVKHSEQAFAWWKNWIGTSIPPSELEFTRGVLNLLIRYIKDEHDSISGTVAEQE